MSLNSSALYIPVVTPPTPAPSPGPNLPPHPTFTSLYKQEFSVLPPYQRRQFLSAVLSECTPDELLFVSTTVAPLLKRDFLRDLPPELAIHILGFIDDPRSLLKAGQVSRYWHSLVAEECLWKRMCDVYDFDIEEDWDIPTPSSDIVQPPSPISPSPSLREPRPPTTPVRKLSYRNHFKLSYMTLTKWRTGGTLLRRIPLTSHHHLPNDAMQPPVANPSSAVPTSIALDPDWLVIGLANSRIHVFSARTGVSCRTLVGHSAGVWAVALVRAGGRRIDPPIDARMRDMHIGRAPAGHRRTRTEEGIPASSGLSFAMRAALGLDQMPADTPRPSRTSSQQTWPHGRPSEPSGSSEGWGQPNALVVSGGCDKDLRVWDVVSGFCIYALKGHTSTIRCLKVLHNRPIAVTGSRDRTLRVWDIQHGKCLRVLDGHEDSVRSIDVCGNKVASGSYDFTCRLWNIDTGECLHVMRGHHHQIYSVAFDGIRIASGGMDTTVRVWDAETGTCAALLQGHTALVCQVQLYNNILVTGGSDGRVIIFSIVPGPAAPASPPALSAAESVSSQYTRAFSLPSPATPPSPPRTAGGAPASTGRERPFSIVQRLAAHDSSVTGLQFDARFLVTGGNDGRVRLFEFRRDAGCAVGHAPGAGFGGGALSLGAGVDVGGGGGLGGKFEYVREMSEPCESVWKVAYTAHTCAVMCKRAGKTQVEIWSFRPGGDVRE
ncbi:WD40 repeat-like protein [Phanerochaete sordida]|uniref:WD40 repeat-like protein n=1 Tax=Phanerochaete sordida TaxID=48140 RepID=A0A9P3G7B0_9APHY|nr:WD40 repeat-like protein [Phanerochaete sordida]